MKLRPSFYAKYYHLKGDYFYPMWVYNALIKQEDVGFTNDSTIYIGSEIKEVKTSDIVGTVHSRYYNSKNWLDFFDCLKRGQTLENLEWYSKFFTNDKIEKFTNGSCSVLEFNSQYWIGQGNHRICTAKIIGLDSIIVPVDHYRIK